MSRIVAAKVTQAFSLPGYETKRSLGMVRGLTVRSRSIIGNFIGGVHAIFGGQITVFVELCEQARANAYQAMLEAAEARGANAVIGVRYESNQVAAGITEVLCYGTAVEVI